MKITPKCGVAVWHLLIKLSLEIVGSLKMEQRCLDGVL